MRLVSTTVCQSLHSTSGNGAGGAPMPALLNSRSTRPACSRTRANRASTDSGERTSAGTTSGGAVRGGLAQGVLAPARERDLPAGFEQRARDLAADPRPGARDDRDPPAHGPIVAAPITGSSTA